MSHVIDRGALLERIGQVVEAANQPMLAREIAAELERRGIDAGRTDVNSVLYKSKDHLLLKDAEHRWSPLWRHALAVVQEAGEPLRAKQIAIALKRRGFEVDRARVNRALYREDQHVLRKNDDHSWCDARQVRVVRQGRPTSRGSLRRFFSFLFGWLRR